MAGYSTWWDNVTSTNWADTWGSPVENLKSDLLSTAGSAGTAAISSFNLDTVAQDSFSDAKSAVSGVQSIVDTWTEDTESIVTVGKSFNEGTDIGDLTDMMSKETGSQFGSIDDEMSTTRVDTINFFPNIKENNNYKAYESKSNSPVSKMLQAYPDFQKNQYTAFFALHDSNDSTNIVEASTQLSTLNKIKDDTPIIDLGNVYLGMRLNGIEIPQIKQNKFSIDFCGRKIPKIGSMPSMSKVESITFDLDQNLFVYSIFNQVSGNFTTLYSPGTTVKAPTLGKTAISSDVADTANNFLLTLYPALYSAKSKEIDLIVVAPKMPEYSNLDLNLNDMTSQTVLGDTSFKSKANKIYYVFRNIKFLGQTNNLSFKTSADKLTGTYKFTFMNLNQY